MATNSLYLMPPPSPGHRVNGLSRSRSTDDLAGSIGATGADSAPPSLQLTDAEKRFLSETWKIIKPRSIKIGIRVLCQMIDRVPEVQDTFSFAGKSGPALQADKAFRFHSLAFMQMVEVGIAYARSPDQHHLDVLRNIGQYHLRFRRRGFRPQYWALFGEALLDNISPTLVSTYSLEVTDFAWKKLIDFLVNVISLGYNAAAKDRLQLSGLRVPSPVTVSSCPDSAPSGSSDSQGPELRDGSSPPEVIQRPPGPTPPETAQD